MVTEMAWLGHSQSFFLADVLLIHVINFDSPSPWCFITWTN